MKRIQALLVMILVCAGLIGVAAASLPTDVNANLQFNGNGASLPSYWNVTINSQIPAGSDLRIGAPAYPGWCVDAQHQIPGGTHNFKVYSSRFPALMPTPYLQTTVQWHKINYIINHKDAASFNMNAIQAAIWHYDGGVPSGYATWFGTPQYTAMIADTEANAGGWTCGPGDVYAVVIYAVNVPGYPEPQINIIEVPCPDIPVPEFPSIYLPAGMLFGMILVVSFLRKNEKI